MSVGFHVSSVTPSDRPSNIVEAVKLIKSYGFKSACLQIFDRGPRDYHKIGNTGQIKAAITGANKILPTTVVIHGAYVDNGWVDKSFDNIISELKAASDAGASGVIVHLGTGAIDGIVKLVTLARDIDTILWLEINAAKDNENAYCRPSNIAKILRVAHDALTNGGADYNLSIGICIDTAHLHSAGICLTSKADAVKWLSSFCNEVRAVPVMLHLNDSMSELGSGVDRHGGLTKGRIWSNYSDGSDDHGLPLSESGLAYIVDHACKHNWCIILERDAGNIADDLVLLGRLVNLNSKSERHK